MFDFLYSFDLIYSHGGQTCILTWHQSPVFPAILGGSARFAKFKQEQNIYFSRCFN